MSRGWREHAEIGRLWDAYRSLIDHGWKEIMYAPRDGTEIEVIELGSTGVHKAVWMSFNHNPLDICGAFFIDGDSPSHPVLFRKLSPQNDRAPGGEAR